MTFDETLNSRKSTRSYADKPVEKSALERMLKAANLAPSWKNSQTSRFYAAVGENAKKAVREALPEFNQKNSDSASAYIVTTVVKDISGFDKDGAAINELGNAWGVYDCGLSSMAMLLKATQLGLSTLIMGIRDGEKLKKYFNIPDSEIVVSVIAVGYADKEITRPKRKELCEYAKFFED